MSLKRIFLVLLILTLPSKLIGDTDVDNDNHQFYYIHPPTLDVKK